MNRRQFSRLLASSPLLLSALAQAQEGPATTLIVPYPPGGNTDYVARIASDSLRRTLGLAVVVKNQAGAGGTIATDALIRSRNDGSTLMVGSIGQVSLVRFLFNVRYDPLKDLVPVANIASNPLVLTVPSASRFHNLAQLIEYGRANPGALTVAHGGEGSMSHMSVLVFLKRAGIEATLIGYRGGAPALLDTMGGTTDLYSANISEILPYKDSGRIRFLGVSSRQPVPQLPGVPAIADTIAGHEIETWNGLFSPPGTPTEVVDRLADAVQIMLRDPDVLRKFDASGSQPCVGEAKEKFARRIRDDIALWTPLVSLIGVKPAN
ncbi:tripartite-type tricarboxylate transporter receptor subunit TctC [Achromobacter deleyi]|uniref:Bug family tripartite tricarboxylate transporter substrate binding protein n=1 Tax=Achromobacter deleyi TaxID=1353891 RepID=UPI0028589A42|nr:tripartite tricarboxylate transporter substrate binding protein [Achromobacter deleyi]MDR6602217.1 tripartite-type tricarboxylate transporter receptor subunit TctC [Achromobacter deleyi]